ncbi:MAG: NAD(P)-binding domain-containing protein, partial [Candidatus Hydrogenedentes bacterium]|nr:NAD(P)-binding domain-containing protein [Candidatus Hydrogenedentota bacterium]
MTIPGVLGFIGFGNMGRAIAKGLVQAGAIPADRLLAFDVKPESAKRVEEIGGVALESAAALAERSQTLLLAPKPQDMEVALDSIAAHLGAESLVISIAAGISISYIQGVLGSERHVARVMPNTPALVGAGAAGIALSASCTEEDAGVAEAIFESVGIAERLPESAL